jgi:hypothetical protein
MSEPAAVEVEPQAGDDATIGTILALADREEELEAMRRMFVFSMGVSVGLALALYMVLRRDL